MGKKRIFFNNGGPERKKNYAREKYKKSYFSERRSFKKKERAPSCGKRKAKKGKTGSSLRENLKRRAASRERGRASLLVGLRDRRRRKKRKRGKRDITLE